MADRNPKKRALYDNPSSSEEEQIQEENEDPVILERRTRRRTMTALERRNERRRIEQWMRVCEKDIMKDERKRERLIGDGFVPVQDPMNFASEISGIEIEDIMEFRGRCVSMSFMLAYLNAHRNDRAAPRLFDGNPITREEISVKFGLLPDNYTFFNPPPMPEEFPEDALIAQQLAHEEAQALFGGGGGGGDGGGGDDDDGDAGASVDDDDDENGAPNGVNRYPNEVAAIEALTNPLLTREQFVTLMQRRFVIGGAQLLRDFPVDRLHFVLELYGSFVAAQNLPDRDAARAVLLLKIRYLLDDWRSADGVRYSPFVDGNFELSALLDSPDSLDVAFRLVAHAVESLQLAFIDTPLDLPGHDPENRVGVLQEKYRRVIETLEGEGQRELIAVLPYTLAAFKQRVALFGEDRATQDAVQTVFDRIDQRRAFLIRERQLELVAMGFASFLRLFPERDWANNNYQGGIHSELAKLLITPFQHAGVEVIWLENQDAYALLVAIIDQREKVGVLMRSFDRGGVNYWPLDISHNNCAAIRAAIRTQNANVVLNLLRENAFLEHTLNEDTGTPVTQFMLVTLATQTKLSLLADNELFGGNANIRGMLVGYLNPPGFEFPE